MIDLAILGLEMKENINVTTEVRTRNVAGYMIDLAVLGVKIKENINMATKVRTREIQHAM